MSLDLIFVHLCLCICLLVYMFDNGREAKHNFVNYQLLRSN